MNLPDLKTDDEAQFPQVYAAASQQLATCARVDECKDWSDKAAALASYGKQANNLELENMAKRIRARAVRRMGELLKEIEPSKGGYHKNYARDGADPSTQTRKQAARDAGISERQQKQALKLADVPEQEFEKAIEQERPATITSMVETIVIKAAPDDSVFALCAPLRQLIWHFNQPSFQKNLNSFVQKAHLQERQEFELQYREAITELTKIMLKAVQGGEQ